MGNRMRDLVLPPPVIIVGVAAVLMLIRSLTFEDGSIEPFDRVSNTETLSDQEIVIELDRIAHDPAELRIISEKPLFLESRGPWQAPIALAVVEEEPEQVLETPEPFSLAPTMPDVPEVALRGVINNNDRIQALIFDIPTETETWIEIGDTLAGWEVVQINDEGIVLRVQDEEVLVSYNR